MPGIYVSRRGRVGVSTGCLGLPIMLLAGMAYLCFIAMAFVAFMTPAVVVGLAALLGLIGDGMLRVIPAYRRHRHEVELTWPNRAAAWVSDFYGSTSSRVRGSRGVPPPRPQPAPKTRLDNLSDAELATFRAHIQAIFTRQGWRALQPASTHVLRGFSPDEQTAIIGCDPAGGAKYVNPGAVEAFAKLSPQVGRAIYVTHGIFRPESVQLALKSNLHLINGHELRRLERMTP